MSGISSFPSGVGTGANFLQTKFIEVTADTTTTSATFVALDGLSISITTVGSTSLLIWLAADLSNTSGSATTYIRVRVDGVAIRGVGTRAPAAGEPQGVPLALKVAVAAGVHTVDVQWYRTGGTSRVRPVAAPDAESASILVAEVSN